MDLPTLLKNRGWVPKGANIFDYEISSDVFSRIALYPKDIENQSIGIIWVRIQSSEDGDNSPEDIWEVFENGVMEVVTEAEIETKN